MAPSKSRLPDSGDISQANTPMADGNEDDVDQHNGGKTDDNMVVSAPTLQNGVSHVCNIELGGSQRSLLN